MKIKKLIWTTSLMILIFTTAQAQRWGGYGNSPWYGGGYGYGPGTCINILPDISDEQKEKIIELQVGHQKEMAEWRIKQHSTYDPAEKIAINETMMEKVQVHREAVRALLSDEQKKQLDLWQSRRPGRGAPHGGKWGYGPGQGRGFRGRW